MNLHTIIKKPLITEKSAKELEARNRYTFMVNTYASKKAVAEAVEKLFDVNVVNVKTIIMPGKTKRVLRTARFTKLPRWKKAIVEVKAGQKIKFLADK